MLLVVDILLLFFLTLIVVQDFKQRQISWFLIPLLFLGFAYKAFVFSHSLLPGFLFNITFTIVQLVFLSIYFSIKNKKFFNIIDTYLGLGDVLFFLVVCIVFSPVNFIAFYISSLIMTLLAVIIYNIVSYRRTTNIPLAGAMAGALVILMITSRTLTGIDFYNDDYLLNMFQAI